MSRLIDVENLTLQFDTDEGRVTAVFTQGDFVSYTWPDLIHQAGQLAKASIFRQWHLWLIGGGVALYSILMLIVFALVT